MKEKELCEAEELCESEGIVCCRRNYLLSKELCKSEEHSVKVKE